MKVDQVPFIVCLVINTCTLKRPCGRVVNPYQGKFEADDILNFIYIFFYFSEKTSLGFSCESSAQQTLVKEDWYMYLEEMKTNEPRHIDSYKNDLCGSDDQSAHPRMRRLIRVFVVSMKKFLVLGFPCSAQSILLLDFPDAQADLESLLGAHAIL